MQPMWSAQLMDLLSLWTRSSFGVVWCSHVPCAIMCRYPRQAIHPSCNNWLRDEHMTQAEPIPLHEGIYAYKKGKFLFSGELLRWEDVSLESPGASLPTMWTIVPGR